MGVVNICCIKQGSTSVEYTSMRVQISVDFVKRNHHNFLVAKLLVTIMEWLLARSVKPYVDVKYHSLYLSNERLFTETFPNKSID